MFKIEILNCSSKLDALRSAIEKASIIALDSEFIHRNTYRAIPSLIQICVKEDVAYFADFIAYPEVAMEALEVIYDSPLPKVLHAAWNDLEIMYRLKNSLPENIFDTQLAYSAISKISNVSYSNFIADILGRHVSKEQTLSNWLRRPLSDKQLHYAAADVIWLYKAYFIVYKRLLSTNRLTCIQDKLAELHKPENYEFSLQKAINKFQGGLDGNVNTAILSALLEWRQETAAKTNLTLRAVLDDKKIKELVSAYTKYPKLKIDYYVKNSHLTKETWEELKVKAESFVPYPRIGANLPPHRYLPVGLTFLTTCAESNIIAQELITNREQLNELLYYLEEQEFLSSSNSSEPAIPATQDTNSPLEAESARNEIKSYLSEGQKNKIHSMFFSSWRKEMFTGPLNDFLNGERVLMIKDGKLNIVPAHELKLQPQG